MYNLSNTENSTTKDGNYIHPGINDDIVLDSAKYGITSNGNKYIAIKLTKGTSVIESSQYEPKLFPNDTKTIEEKEEKQAAWFFQILSCFYPADVLKSFKCNTFEEFAKYVVLMLNSADKTKKMRAKFVYNGGYLKLPPYTYTFIESMSIPIGDSKIKILDHDKITKPEVDKEDDSYSGSSETKFSETENKGEQKDETASDDMPF